MLQVHHLRKTFGVTTTLADISFIVNDGEHVGLIGPNGVGKSTLLRCLVGQMQPDAGTITVAPPGLAIGYLAQALDTLTQSTVGEAVAAAQRAWFVAEAALQRAAEALADASNLDAAMQDYEAALSTFEAVGGYEREHRTAAVLQGLGLAGIDPAFSVAALSGGQKTRLGLAALLLSEPQLLLLDEPTNHLDVDALEWLEGFVQTYPHAVLIVSHDRAFLDQTVTRVLYLDPDTHTVRSYSGNYSDFAVAREQEHAQHVETWKQQQEYVARVKQDIMQLKAQALNVELSSTPTERDAKFFLTGRGGSKKVAKKAKARERKLERYLEADERVDKPQQHWHIKLDFGSPPPGGRAVLRLDNVTFAYPDSTPLFQDVSLDVPYGARIALVGPNGAGKTTLLRLIEGRMQPASGTVRLGANVRLGMLSQEHEQLDLQRTVLETTLHERPMSETEARSFLHFFLFGGDSVFRRVGECSFGERSRLQLALLVLRGCNLLLLDEPLNHLDIEGREHFEAALDAFEGTVIAVAHDRRFLHTFAEHIYEIRAGRVRSFVGGYAEYLEQDSRT
jgi:ATP-binding cassette subfamily F protein 3